MEELWKPIPNTDDKYWVSNMGNVKHLKDNGKVYMFKHHANYKGYYRLRVKYVGEGRKSKYIHRLVAEAFIPNPDNLPSINHINEIKSDNRAENLEWCTVGYNNSYGSRLENFKKPVRCIETGKVYESTKAASMDYVATHTGISRACMGKQKTAGGVHWEYMQQ